MVVKSKVMLKVTRQEFESCNNPEGTCHIEKYCTIAYKGTIRYLLSFSQGQMEGESVCYVNLSKNALKISIVFRTLNRVLGRMVMKRSVVFTFLITLGCN